MHSDARADEAAQLAALANSLLQANQSDDCGRMHDSPSARRDKPDKPDKPNQASAATAH